MARIPLDTTTHGLTARLAAWFSRRRLGRVADPVAAWAHHSAVLLTLLRLEMRVERRWRRLDPTLQALAVMAPAARIGCAWCIDFGYWVFHHRGVDPRKLEAVTRWRSSAAYTDLERLVLEYAEAMTETPPAVTDELVARLREHLDDARVVELTSLVALENMRSRTNAALGLTSQGFKAECEVRPGPLH
jgi:alkylhydroperoxidase family enzyme